ncbi:hypothetical protein NIES4071_21670 [Calothrix sp. NIES-4071]|nr:hypothetical protein NIES4071_21670 [Calothrix sp. NIES-4071]
MGGFTDMLIINENSLLTRPYYMGGFTDMLIINENSLLTRPYYMGGFTDMLIINENFLLTRPYYSKGDSSRENSVFFNLNSLMKRVGCIIW